MIKHTTVSLLALMLLGVALPSQASPYGNDKTTAKEVRQKVTDAAESIKNYTVDKRDEAAKKAKASLDALDARIHALEERIDKKWEKMDKASREQARATLQALHKQRVEAAEWYGGLKYSTADAWEHMKKGFSDAYKSLRSTWEKAERESREKEKK